MDAQMDVGAELTDENNIWESFFGFLLKLERCIPVTRHVTPESKRAYAYSLKVLLCKKTEDCFKFG